MRTLGIVPDLVVGDFDSVSSETVSWLNERNIPVRRFPAEKDKTDGELAVEAALAAGASTVTITAAWGARIDHSLGNLFLLRLAQAQGVAARIVEARMEIFIVKDEGEIEGWAGDLVSLIPIGPCESVSLTGFQYGAGEFDLSPGSTRGLSNLLLKGRGKIKIASGELFAIHNRPREPDAQEH